MVGRSRRRFRNVGSAHGVHRRGHRVRRPGPVATGLFSGSVQAEDGGIHGAIDEGMTLAEAVRWARERTDAVVVRIAGEEPSLDTELDLSRKLGRRRPAGWEFLDRTSADPPIMWNVIVEREADIPAGPVRPNGTWTGCANVSHSIVQVEAAGYDDALVAAVVTPPGLNMLVEATDFHRAVGARPTRPGSDEARE